MAKKMQRPDKYSMEAVLSSEEGMLTVAGVRSIVLTRPAFIFILRVLYENSPHVLRYAMYDMGYRTGENLVNGRSSRAGTPEKAFVNLVEAYKQAGYGDLEVVEFDPGGPRALLRGRNLFESSLAAEAGIFRTPRAVDFYSRGVFAGILSNLVGKEIVCEELKCEFRGDGYCEFVAMAL